MNIYFADLIQTDQDQKFCIFMTESDTTHIKNAFAISDKDLDSMIKKADVSDHWESEFKTKIQQVLQNHKNLFWKKLDMFNDDVIMSIKFKNENDVSDLKQNSYQLSLRNQKAMNEILKCLKKNDWIENVLLKNSSSATFSAFMTWMKNKSHVIINLQKINTKLISDVYFLSY